LSSSSLKIGAGKLANLIKFSGNAGGHIKNGEGTESPEDYNFFCEKWNKSHQFHRGESEQQLTWYSTLIAE